MPSTGMSHRRGTDLQPVNSFCSEPRLFLNFQTGGLSLCLPNIKPSAPARLNFRSRQVVDETVFELWRSHSECVCARMCR